MNIDECSICGLDIMAVEIIQDICTPCKKKYSFFDECESCDITFRADYLVDGLCVECNFILNEL